MNLNGLKIKGDIVTDLEHQGFIQLKLRHTGSDLLEWLIPVPQELH